MQAQSNMQTATEHQAAITTSVGFNVATMTETGLVVKGCDKIDKIVGELNLVDVNIHSWQIGRLIRRDFYRIANNLFFYLRRESAAHARIREALMRLSEEADVLENMVRRFEAKPPAEDIDHVKMRVVSDESDAVLSSIMRADYAMSKLLLSDLTEVAEENLQPFFAAFNHLKHQIIGQSPASRSQKESARNNV
jgi:hypothetical protein